MRVFFEKAGQVFQMGEPAGHGERTTDHFMDRLLHRLNLRFHQGKLNPVKGGWSTPRHSKTRRISPRSTPTDVQKHTRVQLLLVQQTSPLKIQA
jgi:hypothetical protein